MNSLIALVIIFGSYSAPIVSDVGVMPSLPSHGVICENTNVMNAPEGTQVLYSVSVGEIVQLREQPRFDHRDWVMIKPAQWIPLAVVC